MPTQPNPPDHLIRGRTSIPGPVTGAYCVISAHLASAVEAADDHVIRWGVIVPMRFRISRIAWSSPSSIGTTDVTYQFYNHATAFQVSGATALTGTAAATPADIDLDAVEVGYADPSGGSGTRYLIETARNLERGSYLFTAATSPTTGVLANFNIQVWGFPIGHVQSDSEND